MYFAKNRKTGCTHKLKKMTNSSLEDDEESYERACDGLVDNFQMVPPEYQPRPVPEEAETAPVAMARWPQMTTLIRDHEDSVLRILHACDECEVVDEVAASDSGNVKGNKWVRLHDVVFGGRDDSTRGLIPDFPVIALPSKFKKKVVSIWQYGMDAAKVTPEIHRYCSRQLKAHQETVKALADSNKAAKEKYAELAGKMTEYESSVGALPAGAKAPLPPGAKPDEGGGRMNHSTNLQARQPAGYGYVHQQTRASSTPAPTTPAATASGGSSTTPATNSGQVNGQAFQNLNRLGSTFDSVVARLLPTTPTTPNASTPSEITMPAENPNKRKHDAKIEKARKKKKELEEQIAFMRPMKNDTPTNELYFNDITRQYMDVSKEVVKLINEEPDDE